MVRYTILFLILFFFVSALNGQTGIITGTVSDSAGVPIEYAVVALKETGQSCTSDSTGTFNIKDIKPGSYTLHYLGLGYISGSRPIKVVAGKNPQIKLQLEPEGEGSTITVRAKTKAEELKEAGYAVEVIETKAYKNFSTDVNQLLKTTSGVHIREAGGLGSGFSLSLNGLTGNQVRYFIDGIPMENFGSALTLNNYPVNLVEDIEVYKGVVPVFLGADALGGAVNLTTAFRRNSFLDVAYSVGSFNTHRGSLNGQYYNKKKNYFIKLTSFINHSDNSYWLDSMPVYDLELGNTLGVTRVKRFHSYYTSGMANAEVGIANKKIADKWSVAVTGAANNNHYQHPDNNIKRVFGNFHSRNQTLLASTTYLKSFKNITVKGYAIAGHIQESVIDTSTRKYNWAGDYIERAANDPKGELYERRTYLVLNDFVVRSNIGAEYKINRNHRVAINLSQNHLQRDGYDKVNVFNTSYQTPNSINKNILGLAYSVKGWKDKVEASAFAKQYLYNGKIITQDYQENEIVSSPRFSNTGYGAVASLKASKRFLVKASFELTYRIPETYETLGDGIYVQPNPSLQPEKSYNSNLGMLYNRRFESFDLKAESNLFYRSSRDFIRYNPLGPFGQYENLHSVTTGGLELMSSVNIKKRLLLNANLTYQSLTDRAEYDEGLVNVNFKSRVPNIPYFFANGRIGYHALKAKTDSGSRVTLYWNTRYVHEFYLTWKNLGNAGSKNLIPSQFTHDLQAEYSAKGGRYNISLSIVNLTNAKVYDNFLIQKPGRAVYAKLRYFISQKNK